MPLFYLIPAIEAYGNRDLRNEWDYLLESSENLDLVYQSPHWFEHIMCSNPGKELLLGVCRDRSDKVVGIVPILVDQYILKFDISARAIWENRLRAAYILGSNPLLPKDTIIYDSLFNTIFENLAACECIYLDSVRTESFLWKYLMRESELRKRLINYVPDGVRPYHSLIMPGSYDEYLSSFRGKQRYNLTRQVKKLRDQGGGRIELLRVNSEENIQLFLEYAVSIASNSWQQKRLGARIDISTQRKDNLMDLAKRGLLRSYVLKCGDSACAFVFGYQFRDVYHYAEIAYDESFSKFSPGTILLFLLIEDLFTYNAPKRLNFGIGDASYKQQFGNIHCEDASVILMRRNLMNATRKVLHSSFRSSVRRIRRLVYKNRHS